MVAIGKGNGEVSLRGQMVAAGRLKALTVHVSRWGCRSPAPLTQVDTREGEPVGSASGASRAAGLDMLADGSCSEGANVLRSSNQRRR